MPGNFFGTKSLMAVCALVVAGSVALSDVRSGFNSLATTRKTLNGETTSTTAAKTTGVNANSSYPELSAIPSNFDVASELTPAWGTGTLPIANPDGGSFSYLCNSSHLLRDDPIEAPGAVDASDLHEFVGNTGATANATYASLRTTGSSSCMSPVNRSAQWFPAMLDGRGYVVRPDYVSVVYQRYAAGDSRCGRKGKFCIPLPNGLRFSFGSSAASQSLNAPVPASFTCDGPGAVPGAYKELAAAAKNCPNGARLGVVAKSPSCWDGVNLDSADHRAHVAYPSSGLLSSDKCPSSHPYYIPSFTMSIWYTADSSLDRSGSWDPTKPTWHFASDEKPGQPMSVPGSTFHAGWYGAWDNNVQSMWLANCIDKKAVCSQGDLGNGKQIKSSWAFAWLATPHLVPDPYAKSVSKPTPVIADDGDSLSIYWSGNWTGIYANSRADEEFHGFAVGGSGIRDMNARWPQMVATKPTVVVGFIGANDLGAAFLTPSVDWYVDQVKAYADRAHAAGAKVVWATMIAQAPVGSTAEQINFTETRRRQYNQALRGLVGKNIDALIPFDSDPRFGTLAGARNTYIYPDGLHPGNGYGYLATIAKPYIDAVVDGTPVPAIPPAAQ